MEDRATQVAASDVEFEIEKRLRRLKKEPPFAGVHICPASSLDVPDDQTARLVVLCPADSYRSAHSDCSAMTAVQDILNNRGTAPRIYRNMLGFIAPDRDLMLSLQQQVRRYLAWQSVKEDSEDLNLDAAQNRETANNLARADKTVEDQIRETYCWLLVPYIDKAVDLKVIVWETIRISGGSETIIGRAAGKLLQNEQVIRKWAPALLKMELDGLLWAGEEHIQIKTLWDHLCTYCYLPRLANEEVLMETIRAGLPSTEYFAYAAGFDGERYLDLRFNQNVGMIDRSAYLVKVSAAQKQLAEDAAKRQAAAAQPGLGHTTPQPAVGSDGTGAVCMPGPETQTGASGGGAAVPEPAQTGTRVPEPPKNKRFYMTAPLDTTRIGRDVQRLVEEVISHLNSADGAQVEVTLEVNVQAPFGLSQQVVRTVSENCRTLHVQDFGFEE